MNTGLFQSCGHCWVFQICWCIECSTLTASFFRIWNSSSGIPSPSQALFLHMFGAVLLPEAQVLQLECASDSSRGLVRTQTVQPSPLSFWFSRSGWGLRISASNKFPGEAGAASRPPLETTTLWESLAHGNDLPSNLAQGFPNCLHFGITWGSLLMPGSRLTLYFSLKFSWLTMFQVYSKVIQLFIKYIYISFSDSFPLEVITRYWI